MRALALAAMGIGILLTGCSTTAETSVSADVDDAATVRTADFVVGTWNCSIEYDQSPFEFGLTFGDDGSYELSASGVTIPGTYEIVADQATIQPDLDSDWGHIPVTATIPLTVEEGVILTATVVIGEDGGSPGPIGVRGELVDDEIIATLSSRDSMNGETLRCSRG